MWADSSPQLGKDWLLSLTLDISSKDMPDCVAAAHRLVRSAGVLQGSTDLTHQELCDLIEERSADGQLLSGMMRMHVQVPMALGSGASAVEHKLRALTVKFCMETPTGSACKSVLRRVRALCVDSGTEMHIPDANGVELRDLLPPWLHRAYEGEVSDDDVGMADAIIDSYVVPFALLSTGVCHIFNNAAKDMSQALPGWQDWVVGCLWSAPPPPPPHPISMSERAFPVVC